MWLHVGIRTFRYFKLFWQTDSGGWHVFRGTFAYIIYETMSILANSITATSIHKYIPRLPVTAVSAECAFTIQNTEYDHYYNCTYMCVHVNISIRKCAQYLCMSYRDYYVVMTEIVHLQL